MDRGMEWDWVVRLGMAVDWSCGMELDNVDDGSRRRCATRAFVRRVVGLDKLHRPHAPNLSYTTPLDTQPRTHADSSQLSGAEEIENGKSNGQLGEVFIRCNNVLYIR